MIIIIIFIFSSIIKLVFLYLNIHNNNKIDFLSISESI